MLMTMLSICSKDELNDEGKPVADDGKGLLNLSFRSRTSPTSSQKQNQSYWQNGQGFWNVEVNLVQSNVKRREGNHCRIKKCHGGHCITCRDACIGIRGS